MQVNADSHNPYDIISFAKLHKETGISWSTLQVWRDSRRLKGVENKPSNTYWVHFPEACYDRKPKKNAKPYKSRNSKREVNNVALQN